MSFDGIKRAALERITAGSEGARLIGSQLTGVTGSNIQVLLEALLARALPSGGTTGQVLKKTSGTDYAASWQAESATTPASETTSGVAEIATQTETDTGTDDVRIVTPLKLASRTATATRAGVVELATDAETQTGTDTARAITPANLSARTATETRAGVAELATQAEADTGTDDTVIMTPLKVASRPQKNVVFEDYISGLAIEWVSTTSVKVKTGAAWVPGASKIVNLAADATLVNTTNYTLAASKWYYVYLTDTGTISVVRDDGTNPTPVPYKGTARQQTANTNRRYLGAFKTSPSSTIYNTQRKGNWVIYYEPVSTAAPFGVLPSGAATSSTSVSCSAVVPITSTEVQCGIYNASASVYAYFSNSDIGTPSTTSFWLAMSPVTYAGAPLVLNSSQAFTYIMQASGGQIFVTVQGYLEER